MFTARWVLTDWLRTLGDRTVQSGGILAVQDDLDGDGIVTPFERLLADAPRVIDWRQREREPGSRGVAHGTRKIENVTGLGWHQTASWWIDALRCLNVPAHAIVLGEGCELDGELLPDGTIILLHPILAYVHHGHSLNRFTIGVEIMCREPGIEGDDRTFWIARREKKRGLTMSDLIRPSTDAQIRSANLLGDYYHDEVARRGGRIVTSLDHRMGHRSRVSDSGQRLHRGVTRAFGDRHQIDVGVPVVGSGKPNPTAWSGKPRTRYSWRVRGY